MYTGAGGRYRFYDREAPTGTMQVDSATALALGARLAQDWREVQQAYSRFTRTLREFDLVHGCSVDGSLSCASWLRHNLNMTHAQAAGQVLVARKLDRLPETACALAEGAVSYQHAAVIASCARKVGDEVVAKHESTLVECAKQVDPFRLSKVTRHLEEMVDQDGSLSFFERQHEHRTLQVHRTCDGMYALRGILDAEAGAIVVSGLEARMAPPSPEDDRSFGQRRADALVEVFCEHSESPQLTVLTAPETLRREPGSPGGELRDELVVPGEIVRQVACDCQVQEGHVCEDGVHVQLTDRTQTVAPKLRRQLELRDGGCRFPGCDRPAGWADAHHILHWADGGPTVLANLVLLCRRHHRLAHLRGIAFSWGESGQLLAEPP